MTFNTAFTITANNTQLTRYNINKKKFMLHKLVLHQDMHKFS